MAKYHVLFNPRAGHNTGEEEAKKIRGFLKDQEVLFYDMTQAGDYAAFLEGVAADDKVAVAGGDGTLNRFINDSGCENWKNDIYFLRRGAAMIFSVISERKRTRRLCSSIRI